MPRFASRLLGQFATGLTYYADYYPGEGYQARIVLTVTVAGRFTIQAIVDTGSPWCILDPEIAALLISETQADYAPTSELRIRGVLYRGKLIRTELTLEASEGDSLAVEATAFVPILEPGEQWLYPNFIGLDGFLNRIRFAVDPAENLFYFGPA